MFLAKLEIVKGKLDEVITEKATLTGFDSTGKPFIKASLEDFERRFTILSSFDRHGDVYFFIKEREKQQND